MNIHLGQAFNSHLSIQPTSYAGTIYVNYSGFLSLLETQLGLAYPDVSNNTRLIQYLACLHKKDKKSRFFYRSLQVDDLAVAKKILNWRDELYLAGWSGHLKQKDSEQYSSTKTSSRLDDIADVEILARKEVSFNEAQYIADVLLKLGHYNTQIENIYLYDELNCLPKLWQSVLERLKEQGTNIQFTEQVPTQINSKAQKSSDLKKLQQYLTEFNKKESTSLSTKSLSLKGDGSVLVIKAQSKTNSAQLISEYLRQGIKQSDSAHADNKKTPSCVILAESQETTLEQLFIKYDFARQGYSNTSHARSILQLLPLTLQLLWQPIDVNKLLSFLVHPVNMLPGFACRLLADNLSSYPGIGGHHWNETIEKIKSKAKDFKKSDDEINALIEQINYWICSDSYDPEDGVPFSVLEERTDKINQYLQGHILYLSLQLSDKSNQLLNADLGEQEVQLAETEISLSYTASKYCSQFIELLQLLSKQHAGQESQTMTQLKLTQLINTVMGSGTPLSIHQKEANAPRLSNDPALLIDTVDELIWWDMSLSQNVHRYPWSQSEKQCLQELGVELIDPLRQLKQQEDKALQALLNIQHRLIIVLHNGEEHHSLWDKISTLSKGWAVINLEQSLQNTQRKTIPWLNLNKVSQANMNLPFRKRWWELDNGDQLTKREVESFSSLDAFINSPYQWVLNYKAKLKAGNILSVSEGNQLKGTMTHELFELFFTIHKDSWSVITPVKIKKWFDKNFDLLIQHQAATFLAAGQLSEQEGFRETAYQALIKLIAHLKSAKIKSIKMEDRNEERFFAGKIMGYIDMLLTNDKGDEIVLDLKWGSESYKAADLENNLHTQLAIYSYMRKKQIKAKLWPEQAYFIIQTGNLLAQNKFAFPNAKVYAPAEGESATTLWKQLENSYQWRRNQFDKGLIEMTIGGTEPDENNSIPPDDALSIKDTNDHFNDYETLMGWGK